MRQFGVAVPGGGVGHVGLRARMPHETGNCTWLIIPDCFNAFNAVNRTAALAEVANCVPPLTRIWQGDGGCVSPGH